MLDYDIGDVVDLVSEDIVRVTIISIHHKVERVDDYEGHCDGYRTQYIEFTGIDFLNVFENRSSFTHSEIREYKIYKWKLGDTSPKVIKTDNKWKMIK